MNGLQDGSQEEAVGCSAGAEHQESAETNCQESPAEWPHCAQDRSQEAEMGAQRNGGEMMVCAAVAEHHHQHRRVYPSPFTSEAGPLPAP